MNNDVMAFAFDGSGNLYVGGYFTTAGGVTVNRVATFRGADTSIPSLFHFGMIGSALLLIGSALWTTRFRDIM